MALPAAFEDVAYYDWYLAQVRESRRLLCATLDRLDVKYWQSAANFVLARFRGGSRAGDRRTGRPRRSPSAIDRGDPGCEGCARITTGVVEHTTRCVEALEEVLCGAA